MKKTNLFSRLPLLTLPLFLLFMGCSKQQQTQEPAVNVQQAAVASTGNTRVITATGGSFNVLTYNVAGLPQLLSSAATPRDSSTAQIGRLINAYDVVHVQEDFNYHAYLYDYGNAHPYRSSTSGGAGFGDGLNSLSWFPFTDFTRITWNKRINENALTPKGFTFCRTRIAEGVYIDFYNLHTNAESDDASIAARADNLQQISDYISTVSKGNAVVVMGDMNARYTRDNNIRLFLNVHGMTDHWISLIRNGSIPALGDSAIACTFPDIANTCEIVDKIYFRGSKYIQLTASGYNVLKSFVNSSGQQLSDHLPLTVNFSYSLQPTFDMSDLFGGPHGTPFNDLETLVASSAPGSFTIRTGKRVDNVGVTLTTGAALTHGGTGGTAQTLTLQSGEYISSVTLNAGQYNGHTRIFYIKLTTNLGRTLAGGTQTTDAVTYTTPAGYRVAGFYGNSGDEVDKLGLIYTKL
jgi:endonuclease/exonuclease/phosphatase family metal-dependent hydrolase